MRILFINNDGGGFADHIEVANGTTVQDLFDQQVRSGKSHNYLIRVNRMPVPPNKSCKTEIASASPRPKSKEPLNRIAGRACAANASQARRRLGGLING